MASQNIYDNEIFFNNYAQLPRSKNGLESFFEWPYLKNLLPNMDNINAIDLGCGYGWFCRESIKLGVNNILGIDISNKMIEKAKELNQSSNIENIEEKCIYEIQDLEKLNLESNKYDLAFSIFVFHYIVEIEEMYKKVYSSLKQGGTLLFTVEHPIYSCSKIHSWWINYQGDENKKIWPVSDYSTEGERVSNWMAEGVIKQHRTIGTYINLLIKCGFTIDHVNEWSPSKDQLEKFDFLKCEVERPMILIIKAIKK